MTTQPRPEPVLAQSIELVGEQLRLRGSIEADRASLLAIQSTPEVAARWRFDDHDAEFDELLQEAEDGELWPVTMLATDDRVVGLVQFAEEEDPDYRHASIDIYVDPAMHRRGYATMALRLLIDHLFDERGHHRLTIDPAADNQPAIACYVGVGFRPVGVMRAYERQIDGTWGDGLLMELLDSDPRSAAH